MCGNFFLRKDPDAHMKELHYVTTKENYQNVYICTDITVRDKCLIEDGYIYQNLQSVGEKKKNTKGLFNNTK